MGICEGRVVIVTGAGRGLGRAHALEFARQGAKVVVNDLGVALDGSSAESPAAGVVEEIRAAGGEALADGADVADWAQVQQLLRRTLDTFGGLDVVVNNAGFVRDRMFVSCSEEEWDAVLRVHLKGHFCLSRLAAEHWRGRAKAGQPVAARIINTSSGAGLRGSMGQSAYSAAKAGIAALTLVQAAELGRYGITANAIAPAARTRMTEAFFAETMAKPESGFDAMAPGNVSPLVVWLGSAESQEVTGRCFELSGGEICLNDGWRMGPKRSRDSRWEADEVGAAVHELLRESAPAEPVHGA
ncbi:MAG: SDR family oxidoreductase [Deltaproteobacteria bacterium]|nr:SDR family oxidoreductase [Deltaproteobacteria bacterium]MDD9828168.1 SDR family oxidoreductase [Deltaproteobacteria bacterium]MDD9852728.1 SDR family oxidoreductase [Deltaproteobacteria bacterium]MDD9872210.1 SDR family oxidoreductase [Deltaproteobacteria bacterium]